MERVVLVHGSVTGGRPTWSAQRPLAERWSSSCSTGRDSERGPDRVLSMQFATCSRSGSALSASCSPARVTTRSVPGFNEALESFLRRAASS